MAEKLADVRKERDDLLDIVQMQEKMLQEADVYKEMAEKVQAGEFIPVAVHEETMEAIKESFKTGEEALAELQKIRESGASGKVMLLKKISLAMGEVKRIPKSGWNSFHQYKYANEGDILDGIRPILSELGLALWTDIVEESRNVVEFYSKGNLRGKKTITKVAVKFTIFCADSGESLESTYKGEGEDEGDKGLYKAYTGATKYFLTKTFLVSSGDMVAPEEPMDPEADTHMDPNDNKRTPNNTTPRNDKNGQNSGDNQNQRAEVGKQEKLKIKELWALLAGNIDGFEDWYTKMAKKGVNHKSMHEKLAGKLAEKEAATNENIEHGSDQQTEPPPEKEDTTPEEEDRYHWNGKKISDLTAEEYISYCEKYLPFDLSEDERNNILSGNAVKNPIIAG